MTTVSGTYYTARLPDQHTYPRHPPSPPMEARQCSLPSISNLLGLADAGSPAHETSPITARPHSPFSEVSRRVSSRSDFNYSKGPSIQSRNFPPSPPMSTDTTFDHVSPRLRSTGHFTSDLSRRSFHSEIVPSEEPEIQRHAAPRYSTASTPTGSQSRPPTSYYSSSTGSPPQSTGMIYQQPLPQAFPPAAAQVNPPPTSGAIAWQHHHYLSPAPGHAYAQSQDRYICPTCNKAFSRPSSLRIHSHSHTGEKPFKCSQAGCGKSFSVRSNMKRHERGCHAVEVNTTLSP